MYFLWGNQQRHQLQEELVGSVKSALFINGTWVEGSSTRKMHISSPSDELILKTMNAGSSANVDAAVSAARAAHGKWRDLPDRVRSGFLNKLGSLILRDASRLASLESLCSGMCFQDALFSMHSSAACFQTFSQLCFSPHGVVLPPFSNLSDPSEQCAQKTPHCNCTSITQREPLGVVGLITPFNYPLEMGVWKMAPALAAGNTVVWKPPEQAPLTGQALSQLIVEAGFPEGVINIVQGFGEEVGAALASHLDVDCIGFTGSTNSGVRVQVAAAQSNLKRCNLELGGNASLIVCDDYDIERAAQIAMACFANNGQSCTSTRRIFVPRSKRDAFLNAIASLASKRQLGHALDPSVEQGPMIDGSALNRCLGAVKAATQNDGADVVFGGFRATFPKGYFMSPTCVIGLKDTAPLVKDELFGPVMVVLPYTTLDEALSRANSTVYGLSSNVLTNDIAQAHKVSRGLKVGTVWINGADAMNATTPFGGAKRSGYGKDLGQDALLSYSHVKTITTVF